MSAYAYQKAVSLVLAFKLPAHRVRRITIPTFRAGDMEGVQAVCAVIGPAECVTLANMAEEGDEFANKLCSAIWWSNHETKT